MKRRLGIGVGALAGGLSGIVAMIVACHFVEVSVNEGLGRGRPWWEGVPEYGWRLFGWWWVLPLGGALLGALLGALAAVAWRRAGPRVRSSSGL